MTNSAWRGEVERFRRVQTARGRQKAGAYSIEGVRLLERALRAGMPLERVIVATGVANAANPRMQTLLTELVEADVPLTAVPDSAVAELTQGRDLGGILGMIPLPALPKLVEMVSAETQPILLVACDVVDPGNVGAMARTAHAIGATGLVAVGVSDPFHPKALRTSMGSLFKLPFTIYEAVDALLLDLAALGILSVGTGLEAAVVLPDFRMPAGGVAVWMGSEAWGLDAATQKKLDTCVTIPMPAGVDSFSVNAAAAIVLYELRRAALLG